MKVKVYPIENMANEVNVLNASFSIIHSIICGSLASGVSYIKDIPKNRTIDEVIKWCRSLGANIKKHGEDDLIIEGTESTKKLGPSEKKFKFSNRLFTCKDSSTPKFLLPILCCINQPFGIYANEDILNEMEPLFGILQEYGISVFVEQNLIRFEGTYKIKETIVDGDTDLHFMAGLLTSLAIIKDKDAQRPSTITLDGQIRDKNRYKTIIETLKSFKIKVKMENNKITIPFGQSCKSAKIISEVDNLNLSMLALLTKIYTSPKDALKIKDFTQLSAKNDIVLFNMARANLINYSQTSHKLKKKNIVFSQLDCSVENSLPFLMVIGATNSVDTKITNVVLNNPRIKKQFKIMAKCFDKLNLSYEVGENEILIHPGTVVEKKQISCENDPYIAMSLTLLASMSKAPIVILNVDCVFELQAGFFKQMESLNCKIEYIHN